MISQHAYHGSWSDRGGLAASLASAGMSQVACAEKAGHFALAVAALAEMSSAGPVRAFFVPGRIEVLGKHTDYAGGRSLVAAADRGFCLAARARADRGIRIRDVRRNEQVDFELSPGLAPQAGHWSNYPMTVARRLARNFPGADRGADMAFASDLPSAAGLSSSSAMMIAVFLALAEINALYSQEPMRQNVSEVLDLAGYLGTVENGQTFGSLDGDCGVGTFGGSEDHTAILTARPGQLSEYSYCPVRFRRSIPLPAGFIFAIGASGVVAEKTGAAMQRYNAASQLAAALAELWRRHANRDDPHLAAALAGGPLVAGLLRRIVRDQTPQGTPAEALIARLEHFIAENQQILPAACDALIHRDLMAFGTWVDRSQQAAERLLGNQVPETIYLAASARTEGAAAASAFGAGFGGSVWALVEASAATEFLERWANAYHLRFPERAQTSCFFLTGAGTAAFGLTEGGEL